MKNPEWKYFGAKDVFNVHVHFITFMVLLTADDNTQTRHEIKNMLKGQAKAAGIVYLENNQVPFGGPGVQAVTTRFISAKIIR